MVAERQVNFFSAYLIAADGALDYAVITAGYLTGRGNFVFSYLIAGCVVCKRQVILLSADFRAADGALDYAVETAGYLTGGFNYVFYCYLVGGSMVRKSRSIFSLLISAPQTEHLTTLS